MNDDYLTVEEFNEYLKAATKVVSASNEAIKKHTEAIKTLTNKINEQEKRILQHEDLFQQYAELHNEAQQAVRFLDWTGSGNTFDAVNLGVSLSYDKVNKAGRGKPSQTNNRKTSSKSKKNSNMGCFEAIVILFVIFILVVIGMSYAD